MTTDRLFVILLVMLIPMTGCFGAVDNADAAEENMTTINNYHYNNNSAEIISVGGQVFSTTPIDGNEFLMYSFNTSIGESVLIHYFAVAGGNSANIETDCGYSSNYSVSASINSGQNGYYLFGSHTDCTHTVKIRLPGGTIMSSGSDTPGYSLMYTIVETSNTIVSNSI